MDNILGFFVCLEKSKLVSIENITGNVSDKYERPYCVVAQDPKNEGILWVVPVTSQVKSYRERASRERPEGLGSEGLRPNKYKFLRFRGKDSCFNLSRMMPICKSDIDHKYVDNGRAVTIDREKFLELQSDVLHVVNSPMQLRKSFTRELDVDKLYVRAEEILKQEQKQEQRQKEMQELKEKREQEEKRERDKDLDLKLELDQKKEQKQKKKEQQAEISPSTARTPENTPSLKNAKELSPDEAATLLRTSAALIEKKPLEDFNSRRAAELEELEKRHEASWTNSRDIEDNKPKKRRFEIWGFKKRLEEWEKQSEEANKQYVKDRDEVGMHKADTAAGQKEIRQQAIEAAKKKHPEAVKVLEQDKERKKTEQLQRDAEAKQQRNEKKLQSEEQRQQSKSKRKRLRR